MSRWNLSIPDDTDRMVRTFLAQSGLKKARPFEIRGRSGAPAGLRALAGEVDLLVTGDKSDLLVLERMAGFEIVTPREAVARLGLGDSSHQ